MLLSVFYLCVYVLSFSCGLFSKLFIFVKPFIYWDSLYISDNKRLYS